jgi:hypothetical protein
MPPAWFFGHGHAPACSFFSSTFRSYGEDNEMKNAGAAPTCHCCRRLALALLLVVLVVHSRFTYV